MNGEPRLRAELGSYLSGVDVAPLLRDALCRCDVEDTLSLIARAAPERTVGAGAGRELRDYQLALVVRFLLETGNEQPDRTASLTRSDLEMCCELATGIISSPDMAFGVPVPDSAWSLMHRMAYQQFPDQEAQGYVPRSLVLYRWLAPGVQAWAGFDFEKAFHRAHGLTLGEAWAAGYALYRWTVDNAGTSFEGDGLTRALGLGGGAHDMAERLLRTVSCDYASYRALLDAPSGQRSGFEPYNLNPLRRYPVLRLPDGGHVVPIPGFLLRRITHGLYYDLIDLDRPGFARLIGLAFETYVGKLLEGQWAGVMPPCDGSPWVVYDAETAVVVASLTRPFGALSRSTGDCAQVRRDLGRPGGVVDCVARMQDTVEGREAGQPAMGVLRDRRAVGLVVALEDFYLANGPFIRRIVNEELEARGRPRMNATIQLSHVGGLEALCALSLQSAVGVPALMANKVGQPGLSEVELHTYARHQAVSLLAGRAADLTPSILREAARRYLG